MKTYSVQISIILSIVFTTCNHSTNKQEVPQMLTKDFELKATGEYQYVGPDTLPNPKCGPPLDAWRAIVEIKGTSNILGNFTGLLNFCGNDESYYGNCFAYIVSNSADTLFLNVSGQVLGGKLIEHPKFVTSYWKDTFQIIGGTGKYLNAGGTLISDDYNSAEDHLSHHHWKGTITLME